MRQNSSNSLSVSILIGALIGVVVAIFATLFLTDHKAAASLLTSNDSVETVDNSIDQPEDNNAQIHDEIIDAYLNKISKLRPLDSMDEEMELPVEDSYYLCDVTGDGVPELWIKKGLYSENTINCYTYDDGKLKSIFSIDGYHANFRYSHDHFFLVHHYPNGETAYKFTYKNGRFSKRLFYDFGEEPTPDESAKQDKVYSLPEFDWISKVDDSAIRRMFD